MENIPQPPRWANGLLEWFCSKDLIEEIEGDLYERYDFHIEKYGERQAKRLYVLNVLKFFNRHTLKRHNATNSNNNTAMIKNYVTVAFRNIIKQATYSIINISGLGIGLASCLLILLFVNHELSYDKFHGKADRIYKGSMGFGLGDGTYHTTANTPTAFWPTMQRQFPEVVNGVRVFNIASFRPPVVRFEDLAFQESGFVYADSTFFEIFDFEVVSGNTTTLLDAPYDLVLTESTSRKYFGRDNPVGQTMQVGTRDYSITGVVKDAPINSFIQFDFLASFASLSASKREIWGSANYHSYLLLDGPNSINTLEPKLIPLLDSLGFHNPDGGAPDIKVDLTNLKDVYLYSEVDEGGDIKYVYIFSAIGLLILLIACINYMNLATARSVYRSKEVGLRKTLGANRSNLFAQFVGESAVITFMAILLALVLVALVLPLFNNLTSKQFVISQIFEPSMLIWTFGIWVGVSFLAGSYPAIRLSSLLPAEILKGDFKNSSGGSFLRKSLVVIQFSISIILIVSTLVIYKQINFINNIALGYDKDNVVVMPVSQEIVKSAGSFKSELLSFGSVAGVTIGGETPVAINGGYSIDRAEGKTEWNGIDVVAVAIDESYLSTLSIELLSGESINEQDLKNARTETGEYAFIINSTLVEKLDWSPVSALGKKITMNGRAGFVKGVIDDFHFRSLHEEVGPLVLFPEKESAFNYSMIKINGSAASAIADIESKWKELYPNLPFTYSFMDEKFNSLYRSEERLGSTFNVFAVVGISIACLGLFGLVSFIAVQRAKEIGVRKVLGASVSTVVVMMTKDFLKLVGFAFIIGGPVSYWLMDYWLSDFEYKTMIGWLPLGTALFFTLFIAAATVTFQSLKSALANPVDTLKVD